MRLTKIVCTLGPASSSKEQIIALHKLGMNVARINFSHGTQEQHRKIIRLIQRINKEEGCNIAIMLDTKGPEIRTGDVEEAVRIKKGDEIVLTHKPLKDANRAVVMVDHAGFAKDVRKAPFIIVDNGELTLDIVSIEKNGAVIARARQNGKIGSRRHINLPGAHISLPSVTKKDWDDLAFGVEEKMDAVALSFMRSANDVKEVKEFLRKKKSPMIVISKIETTESVDNIESIVDASDGIMVARGDLGAELPFELIPALQDRIVDLCRTRGKPVIVATHMLESMIKNPMPTRAEVTDVAHAAITRTDSTMLSGETAAGNNPQTAVEAMDRILRETESHLEPAFPHEVPSDSSEHQARAEGAVTMASAMQAPAIVVLTKSGNTARAISRYRPLCPIFAPTDDPDVERSLQFCYGVQPMSVTFQKNKERSIAAILKTVKKAGRFKKGDNVVLVSDTMTPDGPVSAVHVRTL